MVKLRGHFLGASQLAQGSTIGGVRRVAYNGLVGVTMTSQLSRESSVSGTCLGRSMLSATARTFLASNSSDVCRLEFQ